MLPMVARSGRDMESRPRPKNSTNLSTTPRCLSICVTVSTRSVAVTPSRSLPCSLKPMTSGRSMSMGWPSITASASIPPTPQPTTPRPLIMVVCEGSLDAANILKPALSRGEIQCIGATTPAEFRKSIERDRSLERRFQAVKVVPPSEDEAVAILGGVRERYESFHQVHYSEGALEA